MPEEIIEQPIGDNTEGFTSDDYLETPSFGTITSEYNTGKLRMSICYRNTPILNQGNVGACSVFGITKAENEADFFDTKRVLDAMKIWNDGVAEGVIPDGGSHGWSMSGALNLMKNKGYISGWFFCNNKDQISEALEKGHICYTGTNQCNWAQTKKTGDFTPSTVSTGHLFAIVGIDWDNECLIAANSWGEGRGKYGGHFHIPFKFMSYLYSIVAIIDKIDNVVTDEIAQDMKDAQFMKEIGVWNGQFPDNNLEKLHAIYMVMRAFWDDDLTNDEAVKEASENGIATNPKGKLTRRYFLYMVWRAAYGNTRYEFLIPDIFLKMGIIKSKNGLDEPITRYHAVLIIARMLRNLGQID